MIRSIINHENWTKTPNDVLKLMILETVDENNRLRSENTSLKKYIDVLQCDLCELCQSGYYSYDVINNLCHTCRQTGVTDFCQCRNHYYSMERNRSSASKIYINSNKEIYCDQCLPTDVKIESVVEFASDDFEELNYNGKIFHIFKNVPE